MSKLSILCQFFLCLFLFSCSDDEVARNKTPSEITNFLLIEEQISIGTLSNALGWPENIIIGVDLGLIQLNDRGIEKLEDVFEEFNETDKLDFISDYRNESENKFVKDEWVEKEIKKIPLIKLNEIKNRELKNNEKIQNIISNSYNMYLESQFNTLLESEFGFFSIRFWKHMFELCLMHFRSIPGKVVNFNLSFLDPKFEEELQNNWVMILKENFKFEDIQKQPNFILKKYNSLNSLKHLYITNRTGENEKNAMSIKIVPSREKVNVNHIIYKLKFEFFDFFLEIFFDLFVFLVLGFVLNVLLKIIEGKIYDNLFSSITVIGVHSIVSTIISPAEFLALTSGALVQVLGVTAGAFEEISIWNAFIGSVKRVLNNLLGFSFFVFSFFYFPSKHIKIEKTVKDEIFVKYGTLKNEDSINIIDELNVYTEIFFTFIS